MRIVVLDGHTLNPGDMNWDELGSLGELTVWERTPPELTVERAAGAQVALTNKVILDRPRLEALRELRYIGVLATGYNVVDVAAAAERGITVTNVPAYSTASVAQLTLALLLELTHRVGNHAAAVRAGRWSASPDFSFWDQPLIELDGLTLGLVGLGAIGQAVAKVAQALGMRVQGSVRTPRTTPGVKAVDLPWLFETSDVVSLHCPLTDANRGFVNAELLARMKPTALLLNTARGPLVDEAAVAEALQDGRLGGYAADVLSSEPPPRDHPLLLAPNCLLTPHLAWGTVAARHRLMAAAVANVRAWQNGAPQNVVS